MPEDPQYPLGMLDMHDTDQEKMFGLVASLANLLDKELVVETVASVLGIEPVYDDDCVVFDDLAIRFGRDGKVASVFRTIDGSGHLTD